MLQGLSDPYAMLGIGMGKVGPKLRKYHFKEVKRSRSATYMHRPKQFRVWGLVSKFLVYGLK